RATRRGGVVRRQPRCRAGSATDGHADCARSPRSGKRPRSYLDATPPRPPRGKVGAIRRSVRIRKAPGVEEAPLIEISRIDHISMAVAELDPQIEIMEGLFGFRPLGKFTEPGYLGMN